MSPDIKVLVVDDDKLALQTNTGYVERVPGFLVAGEAGSAAAALRRLAVKGDQVIDLVLLDMNLPDRHGLEILRAMRTAGHPADVIAVTSARELDVVRSAVSQGIVQYILKPFSFATLQERLERYAAYRQTMAVKAPAAGQSEVDQLLSALRGGGRPVPSGLVPQTLDATVELLRERQQVAATELAEEIGTSRVTARRYLEYLVESGSADRDHRYHGTGRPVVVYRLR